MDKWRALTIIAIWVGVGLAGIGAGIAGEVAWTAFPVVAICAAAVTWNIANQ